MNTLQDHATRRLFKAIYNENIDAIYQAIWDGGNVNGIDVYGFSVLMNAILTNDIDIVSLIINKGADLNYRDDHGWTAIIIATYYNVIHSLRILVEKGADIDIRTNLVTSALIIALRKSYSEIAIILIRNHADINSDSIKNRPIRIAIETGQTDIAKLLLIRGADITDIPKHMLTPELEIIYNDTLQLEIIHFRQYLHTSQNIQRMHDFENEYHII